MTGRIRNRSRLRGLASLLSVVTVSGAVMAAAATVPASAAALKLTSTKVTLARSHSPVITGDAVDFTGQVTPHGRRAITLQQKVRGKWKQLASAESNRKGAYKFRRVIAAPGALTFRVGVKPTKTAKGTSSPNVTVVGERWHYLADLQIVDENCDCGTGPIEINGKTYAHSVFELGTSDDDDVEYNLKRACVTLTAVAGLGDNASSDASEELDVLLDGTN
jgi:hypothetical protein